MGHLNNCHRNNTPPVIPLVLWCHKEKFIIDGLLFRPRLWRYRTVLGKNTKLSEGVAECCCQQVVRQRNPVASQATELLHHEFSFLLESMGGWRCACQRETENSCASVLLDFSLANRDWLDFTAPWLGDAQTFWIEISSRQAYDHKSSKRWLDQDRSC